MNERDFDGFIDRIKLNGKVYGLRLTVIEAHPIRCNHCGAPLELKYGSGKCEYCDTYYTTEFKLVEQ